MLCNNVQVPRVASTRIRAALIQRAAEMLAARETVTLRSVVSGTGASTMAVYTHFGDMDGLWRAVRQEGFSLLAARLRAVPRTEDPLADVAALGGAYAAHALAHPELYRVMFDAAADLDDPEAADTTLQLLVDAVARAREHGRLAADADPAQCATQIWVSGHGPLQLVVTGVLPADVLDSLALPTTAAILLAAGADPAATAAAVGAGWRSQRHG